MDLHNRLLTLLFPNAYVKFRVVCGWLQEILGGFRWFWMVSGGFGWFPVLVVTIFRTPFPKSTSGGLLLTTIVLIILLQL